MKRIFLFTIFSLLIFSFRLHAQSHFRAGFSFGPLASDVLGTDTRDDDADFHHLGFSVGGIVHTELSEGNSFQFEINYITKGATSPPDSANNGYYKLTLNYLEVPFVFRHDIKFNVKKKPVTRFQLEGGFAVARLVHFNEKVNNYSQTFGAENVNKTEASLLVGINYIVTPQFYFGLRYENGLIPALKKNSIQSYFVRYTFNNGNNMVVQFTAHYIFGKGPDKVEETPPPPAQ